MLGRAKLVGIFGAESCGKTTAVHQLTGSLRAAGHLVEAALDQSASHAPFVLDRYDTEWVTWMHTVTAKLTNETRVALRTDTDVVLSDRTPFDLLCYFTMKHPEARVLPALWRLVWDWMELYDALYYFPLGGTTYRLVGPSREPTDDTRREVDELFQSHLPRLRALGTLREVSGSYTDRTDQVLVDLLGLLRKET